jgi:hypothetical protein
MNLYFIKARFAGDGEIENQDLWVRADSVRAAFDLWADYYDLHDHNDDGSRFTRDQALDQFDCGFEVEKKKRYPFAIPAGAISWDEYEARLVGAL